MLITLSISPFFLISPQPNRDQGAIREDPLKPESHDTILSWESWKHWDLYHEKVSNHTSLRTVINHRKQTTCLGNQPTKIELSTNQQNKLLIFCSLYITHTDGDIQDDVFLETEDGIKHCKLIVGHASLEKERKNVKEQPRSLKARDTSMPKVQTLSGRKMV